MNTDKHSSPVTKRKKRVRGKISGNQDRPRLSVFRSNKYTYLQVIDDQHGKTLLAMNDKMLSKGKKTVKGSKTERAKQVTEELAKQLKKKNIEKLAFDRGSYKYHGRVRVVAETLREADIKV